MDWQIKTLSRKSTLTGKNFEPGDRAVCLVFKDGSSEELGRADLLEGEIEQFRFDGEILGRWTRVIKDPDDEAANAKETMASAEDFFFSLYENESEESRETSDMLKHLLALMLERKRVLRTVGARQTSGAQLYRHVKSKQEISVPIAAISHGLMLKIQDTLGDLIL